MAVLVFRVKPLYIKYSINIYIYITFIYFNPHYFVAYGALLFLSRESNNHFIF